MKGQREFDAEALPYSGGTIFPRPCPLCGGILRDRHERNEHMKFDDVNGTRQAVIWLEELGL